MNIATNNLKKDICFCMFAGMKIIRMFKNIHGIIENAKSADLLQPYRTAKKKPTCQDVHPHGSNPVK